MPIREMIVSRPEFFRIVFQSRRRCGHANANMNSAAPSQRMQESVAGGTCPAMKRPSTTFPDQNSDTSVSSRRGLSNRRSPWRRNFVGMQLFGF